MIKSSEFIKGYIEIIICALLYNVYNGDDNIYNLVKTITEHYNGTIQITNPSLLIVMRELLAEEKIRSYMGESKLGADRKHYSLTDEEKNIIRKILNIIWVRWKL